MTRHRSGQQEPSIIPCPFHQGRECIPICGLYDMTKASALSGVDRITKQEHQALVELQNPPEVKAFALAQRCIYDR
jgi:hypothetical protein